MLSVELLLLVLVPDTSSLVVVEDYIEDVAETFLRGEETVRRRDLSQELIFGAPQDYPRLLQEGIPASCTAVNEGVSDSACENLGEGRFSYACKKDNYLCCSKKEGKSFATDGVVGKCTRNKADDLTVIDIGDRDEFDPAVTEIKAVAEDIDCEKYDYEAAPNTKCVLVTLLLSGPDEVLRSYEQILETALEDTKFQQQVVNEGLQAMVRIFDDTQRPTTQPSVNPTINPTVTPTKAPLLDPCPPMTNNCTECVMNTECLYCRGNGVCFNSDASKRAGGGTGPNGVSRLRFLQQNDVCVGTVTSSDRVCNLPEIPPGGNSTNSTNPGNSTNNGTNTGGSSSATSFLAARYSLLSGIGVTTIIFSLVF